MNELESEINNFLTSTEVCFHGENLLERMQNLVDAIGNPEKSLKIIHVAGTSGKTSTCYFAASLLKEAGFNVGLTVSPHVDSVRERAMINLAPLSESDWVSEMSQFFSIVKQTGIEPSYFEFYMGFAFWLFAKQNLDYVVVETGLGGMWDGSNIATSKNKICIITDIGFDHTEILGDNLGAIAGEKSGIIHQQNTVFMYPQNKEIMSAIKKRALETESALYEQENVTTNFMERNFRLAKSATEFAIKRDYGKTFSESQIGKAKQVKIPARAEKIMYKNKAIIMDGSHNPQKLSAFEKFLNHAYPSDNRVLLATLGSNKLANLDESMQVLRNISNKIILTSFKNDSLETNRRTSIPADELKKSAEKFNFDSVQYIDDPTEALDAAIGAKESQIVITGSFYLLNHLRPILLR